MLTCSGASFINSSLTSPLNAGAQEGSLAFSVLNLIYSFLLKVISTGRSSYYENPLTKD
jgi:hypothetical protein